jgi:hypothetical protein
MSIFLSHPLSNRDVNISPRVLSPCKLDLHILQGNLIGVAYRENVLNAHVVRHIDNHSFEVYDK